MKPQVEVGKITDQSTIRKIAINCSLADCADSINEYGYAFTPIEGKRMMGLIEFFKPKHGDVKLTLYVIDKSYGPQVCADAFTEIMQRRADEFGHELRIELQDKNRN